MGKKTFFSVFASLLLHPLINAQTNCKDIDLNKVPGKWVWDKSGGGGNPATNSQ